ncbi:hypothetical protein [Glaciimonas sp. PCH181]|uniref:hypothetical protein n=1 Tax=Glaciimonas sp. PCH181 TaxID=2133943 RepID=UPI000D3CDCEC|nr:hypothetical protein [Glaciimonas sp. PCH181]PUA19016.1 hypothetical protein C7W93_03675 [Glaciimonas sp. PCH181]
MPLLGTLLSGLFTLLFSIFGRFFVAEKAFHLAAVGIILVLTSALWSAMTSCATGICAAAIAGISLSHHNFAVGLGIAFNSVTYSAAGCYFTVWVLCQIYVIKKRAINILAK